MDASDLNAQALTAITASLKHVPGLQATPVPTPKSGADFILSASWHRNEPWILVCEVKHSAQPKQLREVVEQLKSYMRRDERTYGVIIAPYLSPQTKKLLEGEGVGYVDLQGAARLAFDTVYIETPPESPKRAKAEDRRQLRSVFGLKSARVMRALLKHPLGKSWRVVELATVAKVSVGQVSHVRRFLIDQEWAEADPNNHGFRVERPGDILDAWRDVYSKSRPNRTNYYTVLSGRARQEALRQALEEAGQGRDALLSSYSAANWMAPYARYNTERLVATFAGEAILQKHLQLEQTVRGENVSVERPKDDGLFDDRLDISGMWCTGLIQTYLDLWISGDRGREGAEHLRRTKIEPLWKVVS